MIIPSLFRGLLDSRATMHMIASQVGMQTGFSLEELRAGKGRRGYLAQARKIAMARMYDTGRFSNMQIARFFRLTDHTAVIHARRVVAAQALAA